jgi:hypothetical protein
MEQQDSPACDTGQAMLAHLTGTFGSWVIPVFGGIIGPLIVYTSRKDEFTKENALAALNFQIGVAIAILLGYALLFSTFIGVALRTGSGAAAGLESFSPIFVAGFGLIFLVQGLNVVFGIIACVKCSKGEIYRYPISLRLVR